MKNAKKWLVGLSAAVACCGAIAVAACKHSHSFSEWQTVSKPTCTEAGFQKRVCECGEEERGEIPATGHRYDGWTASETEHKKLCVNGCGTESEKGRHSYGTDNVCTVCGYALQYTENLTYAELKDGETVIAYAVTGREGEETEVVVPAYYNGLPVTEIADYAFAADEEDGGSLVNLNLKSVSLPDTVTKIGDLAFECCSALETVTFSGVKEIGDYAFYASGFKNFVLPASVETTGKQIFQECPDLEKVTVHCAPSFGNYLFWRCPKLETLVIENNQTQFPMNSFYEFADASVDVVFGDGVTAVEECVFVSEHFEYASFVKSVTFGKNVVQIGKSALTEWDRITQVVLPEKLERIDEYAFYNCAALESVVFPEGLKTIGVLAFKGCALTEVTLPKSIETIENSAFSHCTQIECVNYPGTLTDWLKIEFVSTYSNPLVFGGAFFAGGEEIKGDLFIDGVETVKGYAFCGLNLDSVTLGESVKEVKQNAFGTGESVSLKRLVILGRSVNLVNVAMGYRLTKDTEVFYKGTAEEMKENVTGNDAPYYKHCIHYFYSESPETETIPTPDSTWKFDGFWKFASDGKTIQKTEIKNS